MQPEQGQNHTLDRPADMRVGAATPDASAPLLTSPAEAGALPAERRGRRKTAAQAAGRGWHVVLLVILGATDDRAPKGFAGLAIGLTLTLIHLISIPISNTSVNPARSTGVASLYSTMRAT